MNQHDRNELESELTAFRPQPISQQLRHRIADSLVPPSAPRSSRARESLLRAALVAGGLIAATVVIMIGQPQHVERGPVESVVANAKLEASLDQRSPSLWVYRQASLQSPAALDQLLDKHAREQRASSSPSVRGFSFAPSYFPSQSGDL